MILRSREVTCRLAVILAWRGFGEGVLSIFLRKLWPPLFILVAVEGWGEKEIYTKGVVDGQN